MSKTPTAYIYTLGCRVNSCESLSLADRLKEQGFRIIQKLSSEAPDLVVVNTCAVTAESERKSQKAIRSLSARFPEALVIATGCGVQLSKNSFDAHVLSGNSDKDLLCQEAMKYLSKHPTVPVDLVRPVEELKTCSDSFCSTRYKTKCHVKIEDGCDSHCAYCIIPSLRGRVRSKSPEVLLREIEERIGDGAREIVLTGIETGSYGKDLPDVDLGSLLLRADKLEGLYLLRLGSMDPFCFDDGFIKLISSLSHFEKHVHLSVQSGSSRVLALMRRKYNAETLEKRIGALYESIPGLMLTADVIVGFPGESEQDFLDTCAFAERACFYHMHIFPYSEREGTEAATMEGSVPLCERRRRAAELERINLECKKKRLSQMIGTETTVHFETKKGEYNRGYTASFVPVRVRCEAELRDRIFSVRITDADTRELCLEAELLEEWSFDGKKLHTGT